MLATFAYITFLTLFVVVPLISSWASFVRSSLPLDAFFFFSLFCCHNETSFNIRISYRVRTAWNVMDRTIFICRVDPDE